MEVQKQRAHDTQQAANISVSRPPSFGVGQMDGLSGPSQAREAAADNANPAENIRSVAGALHAAREKQRQLTSTFDAPTAQVTDLVNKSYETWFNTFQSGFIAPIFTLVGVFISGPIFVGLYFARIVVGLMKIKLKDVYVIPPYRFTSMGGMAAVFTHTGVTVLVLIFYIILFFLAALIVYFLTHPWEIVLATFGDGFSGLKSLYDAFQ